ncbi:MAG: hypothetical protein K2X03_04520 [Bryobacteraceae bacterium]|nr:hypothetical protein [Bryobacteraceae bacterium]
MPRSVFLLLLLLTGCASAPPPAPPPVVFPPKITQFYAAPGPDASGAILLCYGVESVASVTLEPGGESLSPAMARCIEKKPTAKTIYTLTAKGKDGLTVSQSLTVTASAKKVGLRFLDLSVSAQQVKSGELVSFCFKAAGATAVEGSPGRFQKGGLPAGDCLLDQPTRTTTYRISIRGAGGQSDSESMTVKVLP